MKKIFITLFLVFFLNTLAQTTNPLDAQLVYINQSSVTSGIIYERSLRTTNLFAYNQPDNLHNTANFVFFKQALAELYKSSNNTRLISLQGLENRNINATYGNEVNIGIINSSLQVMNYDSANPTNGGLTFDGTYFRPIINKVPFYDLQALVIAPLKNVISGNTITYKFNNNLILNNGNYTIKTLIANFGDGINRTIISNNALITNSVSITNTVSNANQKITFTVTLSNNVSITTYGKIFVSKNINTTTMSMATTSTPCDGDIDSEVLYPVSNLIEANEAFQGIGDAIALKGKLEVRIFYDPNHQKTLRKPIIIIDGFDPGDKRKITDCDCENDPTGDCQYANRNSAELYDPQIHQSIQELMGYKDSFGINDNLIRVLRSKGYDIVVVNQPTYNTPQGIKVDGGADFIERNGLALVTLLKNLNSKLQQNGSTEKMVVVGPSMGGQISRYALAYMEKKEAEATTVIEQNKWKHNTRLWVAFDSPNHGANVPFGDQALVNLLRDGGANAEADDTYKNKLNSTASKELMIELHQQTANEGSINNSYLNASTIAQGMTTNEGNPYFQTHFNNQFTNGLPNSKGFPMNLRKIAIVNGSLSGVRPLGNNNDLMLDTRLITQACFKPFSLFGWKPSVCYTTKLATAQARLMPSTGIIAESASLTKGIGRTQSTPVINLNFRGNLDLVPGGLIDATGVIHSTITGTGVTGVRGSFWQYTSDNLAYWYANQFGNGAQWETHALIADQCFIPTYSSIGMKNPNQNWANPLNRNLVTCNETYFDSYFGESNNTAHIALNFRSVNWLLKELGDNTNPPSHQAPNFPIQENAMSGPDFVCSTSTYSFSDICKIPSTVTWSWSSNLQVVSQSAYSINVSKVSDGPGFIKATFQNGQTLTKTIWVGVPKFNILQPIGSQYGYDPSEPNLSVSPDGDGCNQIRLNAVFDSPNILEYQWEKVTTSVAWSVSPNSGYIYIYPQCNQNFSFKVRTRNICGWSEWKEFEYALNRCTIDCNTSIPIINTGLNFILNPNPVTNDILNINVKYNAPWFIIPVNIGNGNNFDITNEFGESNYQLIPNISVNITIFNQLSVPVLQFPNTSVHPTPAELDVSSLQAGTYIVLFEYQSQLESYTIIKN